MKSSIKRDLSTLTTISPGVLSKLFDKEVWCISNVIEQTLANQDNIAEIDLEIGTLYIQIDEETIRYKFVPSAQLEKAVISTVSSGNNSLIANLEASLVNKITNTYKDFF